MEVELRNKEENKEVSLGTSKANYMDPRITVAWCKRCDLEISRLFPKTLKDKFNWAMGVEGDWRFTERRELVGETGDLSAHLLQTYAGPTGG